MAEPINTNERNMRYGISALDLSYKQYAEADELMVEGKTGQMLYKRDDGFVTTASHKYTRAEFITSINSAVRKNSEVPITDDDYIIYNTLDVAGLINVVSNTYYRPANATFISDKPNSGFYIRVTGNDRTNSIISYIVSRYKIAHPDAIETPVSIEIEVTELGVDAIKTVTVNTGFDELTLVKLCEDYQPTEGCVGYKIVIKSVSFPLLVTAYADLEQNEKEYIKELNYGNERVEPTGIDMMYYVTDCTNSHIYDTENGIRLNYVIHAKETEPSEDFVVSKVQPTHSCIWAQIKE